MRFFAATFLFIVVIAGCDSIMAPDCYPIPGYTASLTCDNENDDPAFDSLVMSSAFHALVYEYHAAFGVDVREYLTGMRVQWVECIDINCCAWYSGCECPYGICWDSSYVQVRLSSNVLGETALFKVLIHIILRETTGDSGSSAHGGTEFPWTDQHSEVLNRLNRQFGGK